MARPYCRACHGPDGAVVLDLGEQPACDHFPAQDDHGPDPVYPLQMWLCASCGLAQLVADPTVPKEPRGAVPATLVEQAADAVQRVTAGGWLRVGARVAEYGSPHGGSWLASLTRRGLSAAPEGEPADVVLDCFGMMHCADQSGALARRAARVAPHGVLLLQYHSLATIVRRGQWNSLRHGHYAYYSTPVLAGMLAAVGFTARMAWRFDLYGGTVLLAATRDSDQAPSTDTTVGTLIAEENELGVRDPERVHGLQRDAELWADAVHRWLVERRAAGSKVLGYGAASRAVALLYLAGVDSSILPAIADASPAKHGRRMPGTDIPVISLEELISARAESVLLFLPDLLAELRDGLPQIEAAGGRWIDVEALVAAPNY